MQDMIKRAWAQCYLKKQAISNKHFFNVYDQLEKVKVIKYLKKRLVLVYLEVQSFQTFEEKKEMNSLLTKLFQ